MHSVSDFDIANPYLSEHHDQLDFNQNDTQVGSIKQIKLEAFGKKLRMKVKENKHLIAESLVFTKFHTNGTKESIPYGSRSCFYIGQLVSRNSSRVAVNICQGIVSLMQ